MFFCFVLLLSLASPSASANKQEYIDIIISVANNPSREIAQTEVESGFIRTAESPFAKGLRQFTDRTGEWAARTMCRHLGSYKPFNPTWSLKCGIVYQEWLEARERTQNELTMEEWAGLTGKAGLQKATDQKI